MKKTIKIFPGLFNLKIFMQYFVMGLALFLLIFSFIGCQKEEPDGIKIQKSDDGISMSGKYGDKSIDIEKSNKSDKGISVNGKSGDTSFSFGKSNSKIDQSDKEAIIFITCTILIFVFSFVLDKVINRIKQYYYKKAIIKDNRSYSKTLNQDKTIYDYKEKSSELNKIYNLYKNQIYNEQEYKSKKEKWIESLKILNLNMVEVDFLNEMVILVNDGIIENGELETIKYIVSGQYAKDKYKDQHEQRIKAEEEDRKKKEETINNIKNKTKEMTATTINKIGSILSNNSNTIIVADDQFVCECGGKFAEKDVFCANCGKKLK